MTNRLQISFKQILVALLQCNPSPFAVDLAPLKVKAIEEQGNGRPYLQVITNNLERSHERDAVRMQLGRNQP